MSTNQLVRCSPISSDCLGIAKKQGSFVLKRNGCEMNATMTCRANDKDEQGITSCLSAVEGHLPYLNRKCGCPECIIASEKMELKHPCGIQNGRQGLCLNESFFNQTRNEYIHKHQTKEHRKETNHYNAQLRNGTGSSWPKKHRFTEPACDKISSPLQYNNNNRMSEMYATTLGSNGTNTFSRMLSISPAGKGNQTETNQWAWNGSLDSFSNHQTQLKLSSNQQPHPTQQLSRDPRLRRKSEMLNGNDASSIYYVYRAQDNAQLVQGGQEGHKQQSNKNNNKGCQDQGLKRALDWNMSSQPQHPQPQHIPTIYPERSGVNTKIREHKQIVNERKDQPCRVSKPMAENKKDMKRAPTSVDNCGSESKRAKGNFNSFPNDHGLRSKSPWSTDNEELENETQHLEMVAREERIRKLKNLLAKQEKALESLRFRMNSSNDKAIPKPSVRSEAISQKSGDQGNTTKSNDPPHSNSSSGTTLGNSLKRRWLQNWNEGEEHGHEPPFEKEKENERQSSGSLSEKEDQNLSNAEFTALEGLVTLSKN